jgi:hypothetical protein
MATPLIAQSVMVAICLSLLLPAFGRLSETWPQGDGPSDHHNAERDPRTPR